MERSSELGPARFGSLSYPGFSSYSPGGVFRKIVRRAQNKAKERQTSGVDAKARALVVDLTKTEIAGDLTRSAVHLRDAEEAVRGIDPQEYGLARACPGAAAQRRAGSSPRSIVALPRKNDMSAGTRSLPGT